MTTPEAKASVVLDLAPRQSPRPSTTSPRIPHQQLDHQPSDATVVDELSRRVFGLPGVQEQPSGISVPGARALTLTDGAALGPAEAFLVGREFAHFHPSPDLSLHLTLPTADAAHAIERGWAEWHPWVLEKRLAPTVVMVFAPRNVEEASTVERLVRRSWQFATAPAHADPARR